MQREIKDPELPDGWKRGREPDEATFHYRVVQHLVFTVEHCLSVLAFLEWNGGTPHERFIFLFRCRKRIAEPFESIGICKDQVYGEPYFKSLDSLVEPSPQDLGF